MERPETPGALDPSRWEQSVPAHPGSVAYARTGVAALAERHGARRETVEAITLAVSEAASNVVMHAYIEAPQPGELRVVATVEDGMLHVAVEDSGRGVRPRRDSPGMGVGMMLMAHMSEELVVLDRPGGGALVRMRFRLGG